VRELVNQLLKLMPGCLGLIDLNLIADNLLQLKTWQVLEGVSMITVDFICVLAFKFFYVAPRQSA
jgi:hypothetical protein